MALDHFISELSGVISTELWFNPWRDWNETIDIDGDTPDQRVRHLRAYLASRLESASILLIAEAPGYKGARFSGIAMTCERTLLGGKPDVARGVVFGPDVKPRRTSSPSAGRNEAERLGGFCEPTATVIWRELTSRRLATTKVALWNVFPFHPHKPNQPLTNRTPVDGEVENHLGILEAFLKVFPERGIVAIGETARHHLARLGVNSSAVRHPANGGIPAFREGIGSYFARHGLVINSPTQLPML